MYFKNKSKILKQMERLAPSTSSHPDSLQFKLFTWCENQDLLMRSLHSDGEFWVKTIL